MAGNRDCITAVVDDLESGASPIPLRFVAASDLLSPSGGGRRMHVATVYRWAQRGLKGVRLETLKCGGTTVTTRPALLRFIQRLNGIEPSISRLSLNQRNSSFKKAEADLAADGL